MCPTARQLVPRLFSGVQSIHAIRAAAPQLARALNELQTSAQPRQRLHPDQALATVLGPDQLALVQERLQLDGRQLSLVEPLDVDAVMDMYIKRGQGDRDPYWSRPWPSATALARHILAQPHLCRGKAVCEIGAGLGIASIAAAMAGATEVVMTDREPLALECALMSAQASGVAGREDVLLALRLMQGQALQRAPPVRAALVDWTQPYTGPKFDVVLACDVLYEDFSVEPVGALLPQMCTPDGRMLLADPTARTRHNREYFVDLLLSDRQRPMLLEECTSVLEEMDGQMHPVEIMQLRFREGRETVGVKVLHR